VDIQPEDMPTTFHHAICHNEKSNNALQKNVLFKWQMQIANMQCCRNKLVVECCKTVSFALTST